MTPASTQSPKSFDIEALIQSLAGIEIITEPTQVSKLSQDYHTFSPILTKKLAGKVADVVVRPENKQEVLKVAAAAAKHRVPITVRGAGTGNYGQCVPLYGGVVLDMTHLRQIIWVKPAVARLEAGVKLETLNKNARETGWEMRMVPSTYRTATIGGFIAGGSGGIGSINYGLLSDKGNITALEVVTLEEQPQVIELRGEDVQKVNHAWGLNGIITEVEIPLAPAYPWAELVVIFNDFMTTVKFGKALAYADGIIKKEIGIFAASIPQYFNALKDYIPENSHAALLIVAETSLESLKGLVEEYGGKITYTKPARDTGKGFSLGEHTWNHTTLHARSADSSLTYLQSVFPSENNLRLIEHMYNYFGSEVMMHLEVIRFKGIVSTPGLQLIKFSNEERLNEIIRYHEEHGVFIANPHSYYIEEGWKRAVEPKHLQFKQKVDPFGLMNPGKSKMLVTGNEE
ncbi:MAG: FAD-binding oxidoreductase [Rivularia sp. (in: Bacteria)]|nr:FAD-binding oxidoreductase [Rivularia sp. MS3]